jgi:hypothetical protein
VVQAHGRVTPVTLWERTSHSRPQSLVHDPDAWSKEEVTADGMSRKPVSTRPRLRWDNDFEVEGEVRRCVDTFSEHDSSDFLPFRRRHQDRDVAKRTFRRIAPRSRSRATSADDGVVALIGPILASNGGRVPARSFVGPSRRTVGATQAACAGDRPKATTSTAPRTNHRVCERATMEKYVGRCTAGLARDAGRERWQRQVSQACYGALNAGQPGRGQRSA